MRVTCAPACTVDLRHEGLPPSENDCSRYVGALSAGLVQQGDTPISSSPRRERFGLLEVVDVAFATLSELETKLIASKGTKTELRM